MLERSSDLHKTPAVSIHKHRGHKHVEWDSGVYGIELIWQPSGI